MNNQEKYEMEQLAGQAIAGDREALELVLMKIQDTVFNLSLRMLGVVADAEDASQEILIKVMTHLSSFRQESSFATWVFRIAVNHLKDYKKSMFARHPLSFEYYGQDIAQGKTEDIPDLTKGVERSVLEEELKMSCTNVMLQCLDKESRCIFIFGTMFRLDSRVAGDILGITPDAYRKRLSRVREKMAAFMNVYCGLSGKGMCNCSKRLSHAISNHRINPEKLEFSALEQGNDMVIQSCKNAMEKVDELTFVYSGMPFYRAGKEARAWIKTFMKSSEFQTVINAGGGK